MKDAAKKKAKGKIVIDRDLCKGCKYCVIYCPKGLIVMDGTFNSMGYFPAMFEDKERECTGCAICAQMCPEIAIEVWRED
ncbi:MAG: ferredoxin family protein [Nitrospirae bacterium]|nr:ferredoxin family protein [Nitrospirota bacterium]